MSDLTNHTISEEMVKLIFNPLRESLAETTLSIKESTIGIANLVQTLSNHPNKTDLKNIMDSLLKDIETNIDKYLTKGEIDFTSKLADQTKILVELNEKNKDTLITNSSHIVEEIGKLNTIISDLISKVDMLIASISIAFAIGMIAWGVVAFIFNFKE